MIHEQDNIAKLKCDRACRRVLARDYLRVTRSQVISDRLMNTLKRCEHHFSKIFNIIDRLRFGKKHVIRKACVITIKDKMR